MFIYAQLAGRAYIVMAPIFVFCYFHIAVILCSESLGQQKASFPLLMWKAFKYVGVLVLLVGPVFVGQPARAVPFWLWAWDPALRNGASMSWLLVSFVVLYISFLLIVVAVNWFPAKKAD